MTAVPAAPPVVHPPARGNCTGRHSTPHVSHRTTSGSRATHPSPNWASCCWLICMRACRFGAVTVFLPKLGSLLTHYRPHGIAALGLPVPDYSNAPAVATVCARTEHRRIRQPGILAESSRCCRTRDPLAVGSSARDRRSETTAPSCLPFSAQRRAHANAPGWCAISVRPVAACVLSGHVDCAVREVPDTSTPSRSQRRAGERRCPKTLQGIRRVDKWVELRQPLILARRRCGCYPALLR
jgi:hypothetical protein